MNSQHSLSRRNLIKATILGGIGLGSAASPLSLFAQDTQSQKRTRGIQGQTAPELQVPYWIDGKGKEQKAFNIAANRGKWVYLKCFQNWCPGCHSIGFPGLQKLVKAFPNHNQLAIAAIQTTFEGFSSNNQDALRKNQLRYELDIPFGHDSGDSNAPHGDRQRYPNTMVSYRTGGTPWIVVINPQGQVVFNDFHIDTDKFIQFLSQQFA
ncbi:MAG: peroxiredoxin family protein [Cellvibrionaceae bacterium]